MDNIHNKSFKNIQDLEKVEQCGCFYCLKVYSPKEIVECVDDNQTALCPHCGVDSVLPQSDMYNLNQDFLHSMRVKWFEI